MAETCIVCLGDLRIVAAEDRPPEDAEGVLAAEAAKRIVESTKSVQTDDETIAHLLPCKHDLHNSCLKPWVERANSCPICRATFNMVQLSHTVGGDVVDSYAVQDKVQEAELDPAMIVAEDELFAVEAWDLCLICDGNADTHELMYCDGCERAVHVFCAGFDEEVPDVWYCEPCLADLERSTELPASTLRARRQPRRRAAATSRRSRRNNDVIWARVWQEVSQRLNLDLDFPFDDEPAGQRTDEQRRDIVAWQRRLEEANRQGAADRIRGIATARLQPPPAHHPQPESQEELRAWNAFDKARESQEAPPAVRRRKRKTTASPASPVENDGDEHQLKRPRLRRPPTALELSAPESSRAAPQRNGDGPTFLSSLLREVEHNPSSANSPGASEPHNGQISPRNSSPVRSPTSSGHATPRQLSVTPPPQGPRSPPLSSTIVPAPFSSPVAATYSPFSPTDTLHDPSDVNGLHHRGRRRLVFNKQRKSEAAMPQDRAASSSPNRSLSYSAKQEIQRMVKLALGPRYRDKEISKDQYTDINRDVSRKMYDMVGDASALADHAERERWQEVANGEVKTAISALHFGQAEDGSTT